VDSLLKVPKVSYTLDLLMKTDLVPDGRDVFQFLISVSFDSQL
jgi:hypothetical protein